MRETKNRDTENKIAVDIEGLSAMLSCRNATAKKIGEDAHARITVICRKLNEFQIREKWITYVLL